METIEQPVLDPVGCLLTKFTSRSQDLLLTLRFLEEFLAAGTSVCQLPSNRSQEGAFLLIIMPLGGIIRTLDLDVKTWMQTICFF